MNLDERLERLMHASICDFKLASGGYSDAKKGTVSFDNGRTAFLKAATDDQTADWLRSEYKVYEHINSHVEAKFLPRVLCWDDDDSFPLLLLEDLSQAHWPPPWNSNNIDRVVDLLSRIHEVPPMPGMTTLESYRDDLSGWSKIADDPTSFLSLSLCSHNWLDAALPNLIAAEESAILNGDDFVHMDIRSDNLCFTSDRAILVDWNWACVGNGVFDLATWLPSLHAEGGPPPETLLPDAPEMAAALSGFYAAKAGLPPFEAPLRNLQKYLLRPALLWTARALRLPKPDGPHA